MKYLEVNFNCTPNNTEINEILVAYLSTIGFESFAESNVGTIAYITQSIFDEGMLQSLLTDTLFASKITYTYSELEDINWNEEWEKYYFKPLVIDDRCIIQSTFHNAPTNYEYNIYIDPKMAFGTGHHQTTELVIREMLNSNFGNKTVLDMGCGTAILAILASMRGASTITAIDIDKWAYSNALENTKLNNVHNIDVHTGDASMLGGNSYDIILANINRNILLADIHVYASVLASGGYIIMSGFCPEDIEDIRAECAKHGLIFCHSNTKDNWAAIKFRK